MFPSSLLSGPVGGVGSSASAAAAPQLDFNQLLRESRHLESAMEGVATAFTARASVVPSSGVSSSSLSSGPILSVRVPTLQRSLAQLTTAAKRLARHQIPTDAATDSQAQLLLAAKGIDIRKQQRALKEIELSLPTSRPAAIAAFAQGTNSIESFHPLEIERFLQQQQHLLCHQAMEEAAKVTSDTYHLHDLSSLSDDWDASKRDILDSLGFRGGAAAFESTSTTAAAMQLSAGDKRKATMEPLQAGPTGPVLAMEQAIYANMIQELNRSRVRRHPVNLLQSLKTASAQVDEFFSGGGSSTGNNGLAPGDVGDCWDVLQSMLNPNASSSAAAGTSTSLIGLNTSQTMVVDSAPLTEKVYASAWSSPSTSPDHLSLTEQLIEGSKMYTQNLFASYIRSVVLKYPELRTSSQHHHTNLSSSKAYGKSSFHQHISAYVNILAPTLPTSTKDVLLDGIPFWPQVYFAFRCGQPQLSLELMQRQSSSNTGVAGVSTSFLGSSTGVGGGSTSVGVVGGSNYRTLLDLMEKRTLGERSLTSTMWLTLHEEYQRELSSAVNLARSHGSSSAHALAYIDPYKLALYHIFGRFKLPQHFDLSQHVCPTTEDYIWLKLSLLDHSMSVGGGSVQIPTSLKDQIDVASLSLGSLQNDFLQRGENAFNPDGRQPLTYFKVLLLTQLYEQAVYYLIRTPYFSIGVHFAIVLEYYGLLNTHHQASSELLIAQSASSAMDGPTSSTSNTTPRFAINYSRVLRKYVESFVRTHPFESFHYLYLLHPQIGGGVIGRRGGAGIGGVRSFDHTMGDEDEESLIVQRDTISGVNQQDTSFPAMRDLLLETKEYELLVGTIGGSSAVSAAGAATPAGPIAQVTQRGLIYAYYTRAEAQYLLTETAACMDHHGLITDAIQLYVLSGRIDLGVELLLKSLSPLVSSSIHTAERMGLVELAQLVQRVLRSPMNPNTAETSESSQRALHQLLKLVNYFDLYHLGPTQYDSALILLFSEEIDLIPSSQDQVGEKSSRFENRLVTHVQIQRTISEIAISTMDMYYVQFQILKREMQQHQGYGGLNLPSRDPSKQLRLQQLRSQARALLDFVNLVHSSRPDTGVCNQLSSIVSIMAA